MRYCKDNHINKVPETLDEKIWSDIKDKINPHRKIIWYEIENTSRSVERGFLTCLQNMATKNLMMRLLILN